LAWAVSFNIVARGQEVEFRRNAAIDVRFSGRPTAPDSKLNLDILNPNTVAPWWTQSDASLSVEPCSTCAAK